jgi:hypothetical protein
MNWLNYISKQIAPPLRLKVMWNVKDIPLLTIHIVIVPVTAKQLQIRGADVKKHKHVAMQTAPKSMMDFLTSGHQDVDVRVIRMAVALARMT